MPIYISVLLCLGYLSIGGFWFGAVYGTDFEKESGFKAFVTIMLWPLVLMLAIGMFLGVELSKKINKL